MCQQFLISLISILISIFLLWVLFLNLGRGNSVPDNVPSPQQRSGALRDMHGGASEREAKQRYPISSHHHQHHHDHSTAHS